MSGWRLSSAFQARKKQKTVWALKCRRQVFLSRPETHSVPPSRSHSEKGVFPSKRCPECVRERESGFWCLSLCFRPNPETQVGPFHNQVKPCCRFCPGTGISQPDFAPK